MLFGNPCTGVDMHLTHNKAYNLIRNFGVETARLMAERDYDDELKMKTFELSATVYDIYKKELEMGIPFAKAMADYIVAQNKAIEVMNNPDIKTMASGFAESVKIIAKSGFKTVDVNEYNKRIDFCKQCEHLMPSNKDRLRCSICGCYMIVKAKFKEMHCPVKLW